MWANRIVLWFYKYLLVITFFCSDVQVIQSSEWPWILGLQGSTVKEIFSYAFEENMDVALLAFTSWFVWNRRNQLRFKESACPLNQILPLVKERKMEFQRLLLTIVKMQHRKHTRWKPPDRDYYKVNYDGAIFEQQGKQAQALSSETQMGKLWHLCPNQFSSPQQFHRWKQWQQGKRRNLLLRSVLIKSSWKATLRFSTKTS